MLPQMVGLTCLVCESNTTASLATSSTNPLTAICDDTVHDDTILIGVHASRKQSKQSSSQNSTSVGNHVPTFFLFAHSSLVENCDYEMGGFGDVGFSVWLLCACAEHLACLFDNY